ncbi:hypothetical protein JCM8097_001057 [Rhodosporidiobolus ruineniae]
MSTPRPAYSTYGNRLGGSRDPYTALPTQERPEENAGMAALARSMNQVSLGGGGEDDEVLAYERRAWDRILNDELLPSTSKSQALSTLEILTTILQNVLDLPADSDGREKQRTIRLRNEKIKTNIVEVKGAVDILVQSGFRKHVHEFEEKLTFPVLACASSNRALLSRLRTGHRVLSDALASARSAAELEQTRKDAAEAEKGRRMGEVLEGIKADREMVNKRAERERERRRRAREEQAVREQATREGREWDRA